MITIRSYQEQDALSIEAIIRRAFTLTAFDVDPLVPTGTSAEVAWRVWASPALTRADEVNTCLVAEDSDTSSVLGFVIFGAHNRYSKILGKKIASIILIAVDPDRGMEKGIGTALLQTLIEKLAAMDFRYISVGTDTDNMAAMGLYQKCGFRTVLNWGNWRFYADHNMLPEVVLPQSDIIEPVHEGFDKDTIKALASLFGRPSSLVNDKRFSQQVRKNFEEEFIKNVVKDINANTIKALVLKKDDMSAGLATYQEVDFLTEITGKPWIRIHDLNIIPVARSQNNGTRLLLRTMQQIVSEYGDDSIIEVFCPLNNWAMHKVLMKAHFQLVHCDTTLHLKIG